MRKSSIEMLLAARKIANYAVREGASFDKINRRAISEHLGAVLADSILQAGLNYRTVVLPRVLSILRVHSAYDTTSSLLTLVSSGGVGTFLNWRHQEKVSRFEALVVFLHKCGVENTVDLRKSLLKSDFLRGLSGINGVGPKTIDYMSCLVGVDSIAVDRHVRALARGLGIASSDYIFLRESFCCAADLLSISRREFDAWLWSRASTNSQAQLIMGF